MNSTAALDRVTDLAHSAAELARVEWHQVEPGDLPAAASDLARARSIMDAALVGVVERLTETDAATDLGWASAKDFLTHPTGGRKGAGGGLVRTAEQTRALPAVRAALAAGDISLTQARVIAGRVTTLPRVEELRVAAAQRLLDLVDQHGYDATDLDHAFAGVVRELDPDGTLLGTDQAKEQQERGAHHARFLSLTPDDLGGVRIRGYATPEDAELVKATLLPLAAPVTTPPGACGGDPDQVARRDPDGRRLDPGCPTPGCGHDGRDPCQPGARMWDALLEACRRLQATDTLPHAHGTTARITLTLSLDDLQAPTNGTGPTTEGGVPAGSTNGNGSTTGAGSTTGVGLLPSDETLSATAARRLACDAEIIPAVLGAHGEILDLGRTQRLVSTGLWNALVLRDRHCAFPGCTRLPIACDAHHIIHWTDGGPTSLANTLLLCRHHHTTVHHTPWTVTIDPTTHRPLWQPPPPVDDRHRFTYRPATTPPPPLVA